MSSVVTPCLSPPMIIAGLVDTGERIPIALAIREIRLVPTPGESPSCVKTLLSETIVAEARLIGPEYSLPKFLTM